jgi:hypothetical protein
VKIDELMEKFAAKNGNWYDIDDNYKWRYKVVIAYKKAKEEDLEWLLNYYPFKIPEDYLCYISNIEHFAVGIHEDARLYNVNQIKEAFKYFEYEPPIFMIGSLSEPYLCLNLEDGKIYKQEIDEFVSIAENFTDFLMKLLNSNSSQYWIGYEYRQREHYHFLKQHEVGSLQQQRK